MRLWRSERVRPLSVHVYFHRPFVLIYWRHARWYPKIRPLSPAEAKARTDALFDSAPKRGN